MSENQAPGTGPQSRRGSGPSASGDRKKRPSDKRSSKKASTAKAGGAGAGGGAVARGAAKGDKPRKGFFARHRILTTLALVAVIVIAIPVIIVGLLYARQDVPTPESMKTNQVSEIFYSDDSTLMGRIVPPEGNRTMVTLDDIPVHVRNAVLAAEDRSFYSNSGFDPVGIARAVKGQITGEATAGGGSTITQQYVKNTMVGNEVTYERKAKEILIAAKMTTQWSKDQILEAYLNTIYFGRSAYGINAAAEAYFNKPVKNLTFEEGAILAGMIQSPSALDPIANRPAAEARWNYVLDGMVEMGALPTEQRAEAVFPAIVEDVAPVEQNVGHPANGPIRRQVLAELAESGISEDVINQRGLRIITTIDPKVQDSILAAVDSTMQWQPEANRTAVVSTDPKTGAVRGYYGGDDAEGWDYANAALQTGSTFKVFGLAAALDQGIPLSQPISSAPVYSGNVTIGNAGGMSCGTCSIAMATKLSLNTSFIRLQQMLANGPQDTADMAHKAGIPKNIPGLPYETLTEQGQPPFDGVILGQYPVRPLDMAAAFGTFAAEGVYHRTHFVEKVIAADGEVLLDNSDIEGEQRIDKDVANNVVSAMEPVAAYSRGHALAGGRPSASKSGTAQLGDTGNNKDAWFIGFTPSLSTAVWMGTDDNQPLWSAYGGSMYGAMEPADIWKEAMDGALADTEWENFPTPGAIGGQAGRPAYESSGSGQSSQRSNSNSWVPETSAEEAPEEEAPEESTPAEPAPVPDIQDQINDFLDSFMPPQQGGGGAPAPGGGAPGPAVPAPGG